MLWRKSKNTLTIFALCLCIAMQVSAQEFENPPAPGFNLAGSDQKAIEIADQVMQKLGGRKNWDNTHYVTWKFFSRRLHVWDKWSGNIMLSDDRGKGKHSEILVFDKLPRPFSTAPNLSI